MWGTLGTIQGSTLPPGRVGSSTSMVNISDVPDYLLIFRQSSQSPRTLQPSPCFGVEFYQVGFGVLKWQFKILTIAPEYSMKTQAHIPPALAAIHNFIQPHDNNEINDLISQVYDP